MNHQTRLTAAEMAGLWGQYVKDTASKCVLNYFLIHVEDRDIRQIIEIGLRSTEDNLAFISELFEKENFPISIGFGKEGISA